MISTEVMYAEPLVTKIKSVVSVEVKAFIDGVGRPPKLVALLIGNDPVSRTYVSLKQKDCADVGIISEVIDLSSIPKERAASEIVLTMERLNSDPLVDGVIPQMPFDGKIAEERVFSELSPEKDVDGLTPQRLGKLVRKEYDLGSSLLPCTPKGIMLLLRHYNATIRGANAAIIGRGLLVGEPLRKMLQDQDATATCYHTSSQGVLKRLKEADIIVASAGRPPEIFGSKGFRLDGSMVKEGCTVVGVGTTRDPSTGKMLFDADTKSLKGKCNLLTPNTGGVGAMTRAVLIMNTLTAAKMQNRVRRES